MLEPVTYITAIDIDGIHKLYSASSHLNFTIADLLGTCSQTNCRKFNKTACPRCHVEVISGLNKILPATDGEKVLLDTLKNKGPNSRLSCQIRVTPSVNGLIIKMV